MFTRRDLLKRTPMATAIALTIPSTVFAAVKPKPRNGIFIDEYGNVTGYSDDRIVMEGNGCQMTWYGDLSAGHVPVSRDLMGTPLAIMPRDLIQTGAIESRNWHE